MKKVDRFDLILGSLMIVFVGIPFLAIIYGIGAKHWYHELRKEIPEDCGQYTVIAYEKKEVPKRCVEGGE